MQYFDKHKNDATEMGYFKFLSKFENLQVMAFLTDLLQIFSRHQKRMQDDNLTILTVVKSNRMLRNLLADLKEQALLGGWEEALGNQIKVVNDKKMLEGYELLTTSETRRANKTDFKNLRSGIIDSIVDSLSKRFQSEDELMEIIEPFWNLQKECNLREVHKRFGSDLDLASLQLQFNEVIAQNVSAKFSGNLREMIKTLSKNPNYKEITTVLSRIDALTPHSGDVERCISANNLIKTPSRNRISLETENKYLFFYFNMPTLEKWSPKLAIKMFMSDKKRKDYSNVIERKATHAQYFKGIFDAAKDETSPDDEHEYITVIRKF